MEYADEFTRVMIDLRNQITRSTMAGGGREELRRLCASVPCLELDAGLFAHYRSDAPTVATVSRWSLVTYPKALAELLGTFGHPFASSDILRWSADNHWRAETAAYQKRLAEVLLPKSPQPVVRDPHPSFERKYAELLRLAGHVTGNPGIVSQDAVSTLFMALRQAEQEARRGQYHGEAYVEYPSDDPAPAGPDGDAAIVMSLPVGYAMTRAADDLESSDPKQSASLREASLWYPEREAEIEIVLPDGRHGWLNDLSLVLDEYERPDVLPAFGSVHAEFGGWKYTFSEDETAHRFRLHPTLDEDGNPLDEVFLLVSETHTLRGYLALTED